jgi:catechol 2,3-dioxygenase-like lactoylglutathione lyase family enzyme
VTGLRRFDFWTTLPVSDMNRAKRFYEEKLGLAPLKETEAWVTYRCGSTYFELYPTPNAGTAQHTVGSWVVSDVEAVVEELRSRGVEFEEYDFPELKTVNGIANLSDVERAAWFKDSEGNTLAVSQFLTEPF